MNVVIWQKSILNVSIRISRSKAYQIKIRLLQFCSILDQIISIACIGLILENHIYQLYSTFLYFNYGTCNISCYVTFAQILYNSYISKYYLYYILDIFWVWGHRFIVVYSTVQSGWALQISKKKKSKQLVNKCISTTQNNGLKFSICAL